MAASNQYRPPFLVPTDPIRGVLFRPQQQQQHRFVSFTTASKDDNPFRILGIPDTSSLDQVKHTFLQLALQKHPDVAGSGSADEFMKIRQAFESIVQAEKAKRQQKQKHRSSSIEFDKVEVNRSQGSIRYTGHVPPPGEDDDDEFDPDHWQSWFHRRTGMNLAFEMSEQTRREVIHAYQTLSAGGKDKGGYWELARQLAEHADIVDRTNSNSNLPSLRPTTSTKTTKRRRRKR